MTMSLDDAVTTIATWQEQYDDGHVVPEPIHAVDVDVDDDTDDDTTAVLDVLHEAAEAAAGAALLVDALPNLRHAEYPTVVLDDAWAMHRRRAWLDAEAKAAEAWRALQTVQQLLQGLAR